MTAEKLPSDCLIPVMGKNKPLTVCDVLGVARTKARALVKEPDFPRPIDLGERCIRYRLSEVLEWAETRRVKANSMDKEAA